MCLGSSKISAPVQPDPQDLYYNGNVFDPKPKSATTDNTSVSTNNNITIINQLQILAVG